LNFSLSHDLFEGGVFARLMPKEEYFQKALYTFDIGQNDLGAGFFGNMSVEEVNASVPNIVNTFLTNVKVTSFYSLFLPNICYSEFLYVEFNFKVYFS
jgi:hypothetical protein